MPHFLYKPHVLGPKNSVTTPDLLIDRVVVVAADERSYVPVHRLSCSVGLQVFPGELWVTPAYALVAAGGGALLSLGALVRDSGHPVTRSDILMPRFAWRLRDLLDHFGSLELEVKAAARTESIVLSELAQPVTIMNRGDDGEFILPRGIVALFASMRARLIVEAPAEIAVKLSDASLSRSLSHTTRLFSVDSDRWESRPAPRYTVGPVGQVEHYI